MQLQLLLSTTFLLLASTVTAQATCGTITLEGNIVRKIWRDSCYTLDRKAVSANVDASCDCDFSQWASCDAGKLRIKGRDVTGVPVTEAKAYWCFPH